GHCASGRVRQDSGAAYCPLADRVGRSTPAMSRRTATYEDLLKVAPEKVAEILDGDLVVSPRPAPVHARTAAGIGVDLGPFDQQHRRGPDDPGGWWILPEPELHLGPRPDVVVPDLAAWRISRLSAMPEAAFFALEPDWACEVVSPSTETIDRGRKMRIYAQAGVGHVWLVRPEAQILEVFRFERGRGYLLLASHA